MIIDIFRDHSEEGRMDERQSSFSSASSKSWRRTLFFYPNRYPRQSPHPLELQTQRLSWTVSQNPPHEADIYREDESIFIVSPFAPHTSIDRHLTPAAKKAFIEVSTTFTLNVGKKHLDTFESARVDPTRQLKLNDR